VCADKRQEKLRHDAAEASTGTGSAGPTRHPTEEMDVDGHPPGTQAGSGEGGGEGKEGKEHGQHPPAKRYRMTDHMKAIVWELVLLSNECCRLENEKKWVVFSFLCVCLVLTISPFSSLVRSKVP